MKTKILRSTFNRETVELLLTALLVVLLIFCDVAVFAHPGPQPSPVPVQETQAAPEIPSDQLEPLLAPIALYPNPLQPDKEK